MNMALLPIGFGIGVSLLNIAIHALLTVVTVRAVRSNAALASRHANLFAEVTIMVVAAAMLMLAHLVEVWVWAVAYWLLDVTPDNHEVFSFAFVNYTTLGYGDIVPKRQWSVLGPMTAMNGVLLFGWSTAVLFQVLLDTARRLGIRY